MRALIRHPTGIALCIIIFLFFVSYLSVSVDDQRNTPEGEYLDKACGEWISKHYKSSFTLFRQEEAFFLKMRRNEWGESRIDTYRIAKNDKLYYVNIGFLLILSYDKFNDVLFLSSGGEYNRQTSKK